MPQTRSVGDLVGLASFSSILLVVVLEHAMGLQTRWASLALACGTLMDHTDRREVAVGTDDFLKPAGQVLFAVLYGVSRALAQCWCLMLQGAVHPDEW